MFLPEKTASLTMRERAFAQMYPGESSSPVKRAATIPHKKPTSSSAYAISLERSSDVNVGFHAYNMCLFEVEVADLQHRTGLIIFG